MILSIHNIIYYALLTKKTAFDDQYLLEFFSDELKHILCKREQGESLDIKSSG